jgi:hypothetical protein
VEAVGKRCGWGRAGGGEGGFVVFLTLPGGKKKTLLIVPTITCTKRKTYYREPKICYRESTGELPL